jgi:hypothetical protein
LVVKRKYGAVSQKSRSKVKKHFHTKIYAIQMVKVIPYHIPCNNNAVSHRGVIWHYYYMGCDMAKTKWCLLSD